MQPIDHIAREWHTLQNNYEAYEKGALVIKLFATAISLFVSSKYALPLLNVFAILWFLEAIYRTYQARLGVRILVLEAVMRSDSTTVSACQLHTDFQRNRRGGSALLGEFLRSALRPGVAFPYPIFMMLAVWY